MKGRVTFVKMKKYHYCVFLLVNISKGPSSNDLFVVSLTPQQLLHCSVSIELASFRSC